MAGYFDWQHAHAADCLVPDPETGAPMSASLIVPTYLERFMPKGQFAHYKS